MANLRFGAIEEAFKKRPLEVKTPKERPEHFYGKYVFNRARMYKYLPVDVYQKLIDVIDNGTRLDRSIADAVAQGMKKWAEEHGATHYTHWFQPLTEGTAEKHDAFVEHDGKGGMIEEFCRSLTPVLSLMEESAIPLKHEAIQPGTQQVLYSSSKTHFVFLQYLYLIQENHLTTKHHY